MHLSRQLDGGGHLFGHVLDLLRGVDSGKPERHAMIGIFTFSIRFTSC